MVADARSSQLRKRPRLTFGGQESLPRPRVMLSVLVRIMRPRDAEEMLCSHRTKRYRWAHALIVGTLVHVGGRTEREIMDDLGWSRRIIQRVKQDWRSLPTHWRESWIACLENACYVYRRSSSLWDRKWREFIPFDWAYFLLSSEGGTYWKEDEFMEGITCLNAVNILALPSTKSGALLAHEEIQRQQLSASASLIHMDEFLECLE